MPFPTSQLGSWGGLRGAGRPRGDQRLCSGLSFTPASLSLYCKSLTNMSPGQHKDGDPVPLAEAISSWVSRGKSWAGRSTHRPSPRAVSTGRDPRHGGSPEARPEPGSGKRLLDGGSAFMLETGDRPPDTHTPAPSHPVLSHPIPASLLTRLGALTAQATHQEAASILSSFICLYLEHSPSL